MSKETDQRKFEADLLWWIGRLPLLRAADIETLTGAHDADVRRALEALRRFGWIERVDVRSPELTEDVARYLLRDVAVPSFVEAFQLDDDEAQALPIGRNENLEHVPCVEIQDGVNRLLARFVDCFYDSWAAVVDLRALPLSRRDARSWWPRNVEGYGCLRMSRGSFGHFFVAWDRPEAPTVHRRARVRAWYDAAEAADRWGEGRLPPILLACPARRFEREWQAAVEQVAQRRDRDELDVFVIDQGQVEGDVSGPVWHALGGETPTGLGRALEWRATPPPFAEHRTVRLNLIARGVDIQTPTMNEWARQFLEEGAGGAREATAALTLQLDARHKEVLDLVASHPYLSLDEMAEVLGVPLRLVQRVVRDLERYGVIRATNHSASAR